MLELDLSDVPATRRPTELLSTRSVQGMQGHVDALAQIARAGNLTMAELGARFAHSLTFALLRRLARASRRPARGMVPRRRVRRLHHSAFVLAGQHGGVRAAGPSPSCSGAACSATSTKARTPASALGAGAPRARQLEEAVFVVGARVPPGSGGHRMKGKVVPYTVLALVVLGFAWIIARADALAGAGETLVLRISHFRPSIPATMQKRTGAWSGSSRPRRHRSVERVQGDDGQHPRSVLGRHRHLRGWRRRQHRGDRVGCAIALGRDGSASSAQDRLVHRALLVRDDSPIRTLADLKGKKIGGSGAAASRKRCWPSPSAKAAGVTRRTSSPCT